eukprot:4433923-Amphidinium_carterae.1
MSHSERSIVLRLWCQRSLGQQVDGHGCPILWIVLNTKVNVAESHGQAKKSGIAERSKQAYR